MGMVNVGGAGLSGAVAAAGVGAKRPRVAASGAGVSTAGWPQLGAEGGEAIYQAEVVEEGTWGKRAKRKLSRALQRVLPRFKRVEAAGQQATANQGPAAGVTATVPVVEAGVGGVARQRGPPQHLGASAEGQGQGGQAGVGQGVQESGGSSQRPKAAVLVHLEGIQALTGIMLRGNPMPCKVMSRLVLFRCLVKDLGARFKAAV
jgi:hypothetical protein